MEVIYVDVLLILNFMINFVLLRAASLLAQRNPSTRRLIAAAACGAVSSLVIFLPLQGLLMPLLVKLGIAALMTLLAFSFRSLRGLLKEVFCVLAVSFVFSGVMLAVYLVLTPYKMSFSNGVVYFDISATALLLVTAACYLVTELLLGITQRRAPTNALCELAITHNGRTVFLPALIDTGSNLVEPFSKAPVIVCVEKDIEAVLPDGFLQPLSGDYPQGELFRMIPFSTIHSAGAIPAFMPRQVCVLRNGQNCRVEKPCYIAVTKQMLSSHYSAIINAALLEQEMVGNAL